MVVPGGLCREIVDLLSQRAHEFVNLTVGELFDFEYALPDFGESPAQIGQQVEPFLRALVAKNSFEPGLCLRRCGGGRVPGCVVLQPVFPVVCRAMQSPSEIAGFVEHGDCLVCLHALGGGQNDRDRMLARAPLVRTGAEVLKVVLFVYTNRSCIPLAAMYPRDQPVPGRAGKLFDLLNVALAPIENRSARPFAQVLECHFLQNGADVLHVIYEQSQPCNQTGAQFCLVFQ